MNKTIKALLILILITLPQLLPFLNSKFFYTQDYIFIARLNQMSTALSDGQFPVRWAPDLRFGEPLFNFYAPLPYYIGAFIHLFGFNFIWVAKILFILSAVLSAISMYFLAKLLFGVKAGIFAAVLYTYAPYRAVDMYVRGALSETWAFIFFPLIFYFSVLLAKKMNLITIALLALSLAGLALTHNVTTLMFLPFLGLWWIYLILKEKKPKIALLLLLASVLGFGIAAFFVLPAFFEQGFIQTKYLTVGYFNFRIHFVAVAQFVSTYWGYGSSTWGPKDEMSFQIGLVNLVILVISAIVMIINRKDKKLISILLLLGVSFMLSIFLQHTKSALIWETITSMAFIQFPWRFLAITIFLIALIGGAVTPYLKNRMQITYFILILAAIFSTLVYFRPKEYVENNFFDKFLNTKIMHEGFDLTKDYLPIWVTDVDGEIFSQPQAKSGNLTVNSYTKKSSSAQANINVLTDSVIEAPIAYFPGWQVVVNGKAVGLLDPSSQGLIKFSLPKGNYNIKFNFNDTYIRELGNNISLVSLVLIILIVLLGLKYKKRGL